MCTYFGCYLEFDQHPNSSIAGGEQLRETSTCVIAKKPMVNMRSKHHHLAQDQRKVAHCSEMEATRIRRLRRYVDSIERLEIFSFA